MRLTHLKLAGFKSFVDPTTLHISGQRVGVVGPNGCGKSNVMESVRWVLGESSAKEMRGESMQDVIFNGSANRKPVSRASVELLFDNSLGGAGGEWAQYAEISVKRVLQRDSGSTYYINNTPVRRRDVADLFLGTGLGGRAYAIIGQNTISRIVEAKPEELRVFLEEAAGISKYKERRRETELRLRDTRENLTRVEDIRLELGKQIERLEAQAVVAQEYHQLREAQATAQAQFWLLKKRDAGLAWERSQRQVEKLVIELEAQTAQLRKTEAELEQLRQEHHAGGEAVQVAQGRYYEANAQVSALEQQLRHIHETRERLAQQLRQIESEQERATAQKEEYSRQLEERRAQQQQAAADAERAEQDLQIARAALPAAEQQARDAQAAFGKIQTTIAQSEQQIQLELTHLGHARRSLAEINMRLERLAEESRQLVLPDSAMLAARENDSAALQQELSALEAALLKHAEAESAQAEQLKNLQQETRQHAHAIAQAEAQLAALQKLQQALGHEGKLDGWLSRFGIDGNKRLWQSLEVAPGCETALEGVLGARLNAIPGLQTNTERPPSAVVLFDEGEGGSAARIHAAGWKPLGECVQTANAKLRGVLDDWLTHVWLAPEGCDIAAARGQLNPGEWLVTREGDVYTRHSAALYAPQSGLHGVLERQRELAQIAADLPALKQQQQMQETALHATEQALQNLRREIADTQTAQRQKTSALHAARMELQRLQQQQQHIRDRQQQLSLERSGLAEQKTGIETQFAERDKAIAALQAGMGDLRVERDAAGRLRQEADSALKQAQERLMEAEKLAQQQAFSVNMILNNINELENKLKDIDEVMSGLSARKTEAENQRAQASPDALNADLEAALEVRRLGENGLAEARNVLSGIEQRLLETERARLQTEQQLHPLRDKLEQGRLQEQQARLHFESCVEQLAAMETDEAKLEEGLPKNAKADEFDREIKRLEELIVAMGAVNLAAIQELASERERKTYLDSQAADLEEAVATLEEAIHRIDRETRSRLQETYDEANRHFGELFATLFGGGQAQLQLLGDEILDTGIQVFAQPPGKKNTSIHLLSGGEKALTAIALVFALFRLNPAPFCLMDEVDAPLDDSNTERFCNLVRKMAERTQFMFVSHNKITMEMAQQLIGVTMQESGVSRIVEVDMEAAMKMQAELAV
ncbi:MAG: chromosome segregation protein SMC [Methylobacillus sp.]|jgi:chromosome segregation protein|nr:chromosome segregation protein SMC [Methylobacillus sp.]